MHTARYWIDRLQLRPHPEGGFYKEVYRSEERISVNGLPERYGSPRSTFTSIYYLLRSGDLSRLHRLKSDELWHFLDGEPLTVHIIRPDGAYSAATLGRRFDLGERFQTLIEHGWWFGAVVDNPGSYSLLGCTVAPGFEFEDYEEGKCENLLHVYPQHKEIIEKLTPMDPNATGSAGAISDV